MKIEYKFGMMCVLLTSPLLGAEEKYDSGPYSLSQSVTNYLDYDYGSNDISNNNNNNNNNSKLKTALVSTACVASTLMEKKTNGQILDYSNTVYEQEVQSLQKNYDEFYYVANPSIGDVGFCFNQMDPEEYRSWRADKEAQKIAKEFDDYERVIDIYDQVFGFNSVVSKRECLVTRIMAKGYGLELCDCLKKKDRFHFDEYFWRANLTATDHAKKNTPLHYAALGGMPVETSILLKYGAPINALNRDRQTPLHCAAMSGCWRTLLVLWRYPDEIKEYLVDVQTRRTPLHIAAALGHWEFCILLATKQRLVRRPLGFQRSNKEDQRSCLVKLYKEENVHNALPWDFLPPEMGMRVYNILYGLDCQAWQAWLFFIKNDDKKIRESPFAKCLDDITSKERIIIAIKEKRATKRKKQIQYQKMLKEQQRQEKLEEQARQESAKKTPKGDWSGMYSGNPMTEKSPFERFLDNLGKRFDKLFT